MHADVKWVEDMTFVGKADSNHWTVMGTGPEFGGDAGATKPLELVLVGLGGCSGMDVVSILRKKRSSFTSLRIDVQAERAPKHPTTLTAVHMVYRVGGEGVKAQDVEEAVKLSQEKYCAIAAILARGCPVTYEVRLEP
jgi:putative redox protein